jgi:dTDP-glucose 4,6-dehydratase
VRPFNTYGPRQSIRAVVPTIITQALSQQAILLGDIRPTRDFLYVKDTISGFIAIARSAEKIFGETLNLGTGVETSIEELANLISELSETNAKVVFDASRIRPTKSEVSRLCADVSKSRQILKWEPSISIKDGLSDTIQWFKNFLSFYKPSQGYM